MSFTSTFLQPQGGSAGIHNEMNNELNRIFTLLEKTMDMTHDTQGPSLMSVMSKEGTTEEFIISKIKRPNLIKKDELRILDKLFNELSSPNINLSSFLKSRSDINYYYLFNLSIIFKKIFSKEINDEHEEQIQSFMRILRACMKIRFEEELCNYDFDKPSEHKSLDTESEDDSSDDSDLDSNSNYDKQEESQHDSSSDETESEEELLKHSVPLKSKLIERIIAAGKQSRELKIPSIKYIPTSLVIDGKINLLKYPDKSAKVNKVSVLTVGDMHGNALKFINILLRHGFINLSAEAYKEIVEIYYTPIPDIREKKSDPDLIFDEKVRKYTELIKRFDYLMSDAFKSIDPENVGQLRLLGDLISDRGANDYFTLRIIEKLSLKKLIKEITLSNHDYSGLIEIYNLNHPHQKIPPYFSEKDSEFKQSFTNLSKLIDLNIIKLDEVNNIIDNHFKPFLKLISYAPEEHSDQKKYLTVYHHAPTDFIKNIQQTASLLKITPDTLDGSITSLTNMIDKINKIILEDKNIVSEKFKEAISPFINDRLFQLHFNNPQEAELSFPPAFSQYHMSYVSGHDISSKGTEYLCNPENPAVKEKKLHEHLCFSHHLPYTMSLDNQLGKTASPQGVYFSKLSCEPAYLELILCLHCALPEIKNSLKNEKLFLPFQDAVNHYEKNYDIEELHVAWENAIKNAHGALNKTSSPLLLFSLHSAPIDSGLRELDHIFQKTKEKINYNMQSKEQKPKLNLSKSA